MIKVYHNPRCGKSRNCLAFLENKNVEYQTIPYLTDQPSFEDIKQVIQQLNITPIELVRKKEKIWIENFKNETLTDAQLIQAMVENPILIERPIVIKDGKAIIARDLEKLETFLK